LGVSPVQIRPRVALVLYGQPRFVASKIAARSQLRFLRKLDLHIFGHVWFSDELKVLPVSSWSDTEPINVDENAIEIIKRSWPGITLKSEPPINFEIDEFRDSLGAVKPLKDSNSLENMTQNAKNQISQLYSIDQALNLANTSNTAYKFDYYILTRYDCLINNFPKYKNWSPGKLLLTSHHAFPDPIIIGSPEMINATNAYPNWKKYIEESPFFLPAEEFKRIEFLSHFKTSDYTNVKSRVDFLRTDSRLIGYYKLLFNLSRMNFLRARIRDKMRSLLPKAQA